MKENTNKYGIKIFQNCAKIRNKNKEIGIYKIKDDFNQFEFIRLIKNKEDLKTDTAIVNNVKNKIKITSIALSDTSIFELYELLGHYIKNNI